MELLITSYLLQCKECVLPGLGILQIKDVPALFDGVNNQLLPPSKIIIFKKEALTESNGLIKYIADKKHIEQNEAEELLNNFCNEWKEKIRAGEKLNFEPLGSLYNNEDGEISFKRETGLNFLEPIKLNNPYKKKEEPELNQDAKVLVKEEPELNREAEVLIDENTELIREKEVLIGEVSEVSNVEALQDDAVITKSYWGYWALTLFAIAAVTIFLHFKDHKLSSSSTGNRNRFVIDSAGATYHRPK